jgi:hypothetical protein
MGLGQTELPWLSANDSSELARSMSYFLLANQLGKFGSKMASGIGKQGVRLLQKPLHWRLKNDVFSVPVELWFTVAKQWLVVRRSLLTGEPLGRELKEVQQ